ncbi:RDD family protein [Nocardia jiangxiensis]|uniref:RDD family protein n=1 Tax=Nocardia jiangxiensis TaxID=282685 RepID=A0ABW6SEE2_9NOCA|nr:RDD family protein [Nocardia jiangxiensis]
MTTQVSDTAATTPATDPDPDAVTEESASTASGANTAESACGTDTPASDADAPDIAAPEAEYAGWRPRALAFAVDTICPTAVVAVTLLTATVADADRWVQVPALVVAAVVAAAAIWNIGYRQGSTGRTIGKTLAGLRTRRTLDAGTPPGVARALFRTAAHVVDTVPLPAGWFWPLRDTRRQTFSDKLADTVVVTAESAEADRSRARTVALGGFALLALVTVALTATQYTLQYRRDRATEQTRAEVARIAGDDTVALLSYKPDTVRSDLSAAAGALTGDFLRYYRDYTTKVVIPAAEEKKVDTKARVAGSAVLSADDRHATVLVFIDQTTTTADDPQPAAMSSTVRVDLVESGHDWRISQFEPI